MQIHFKPYRFAVYFTPSMGSDWWHAGNQWLARCLKTNTSLNPIDIPNLNSSDFFTHTADPRRYGWHATLKAPFRLQPQFSMIELINAMHLIANDFEAFDLPPLLLTDKEGFISLRPSGNLTMINSIAEACVTRLHQFAEPLSEAELARRRMTPLSQEQDRLLMTWGYPWVLDEFRFHFSLTGPTDKMEAHVRDKFLMAANDHFGSLPACTFDCLSLFIEPTKGSHFQLVEQVRLMG